MENDETNITNANESLPKKHSKKRLFLIIGMVMALLLIAFVLLTKGKNPAQQNNQNKVQKTGLGSQKNCQSNPNPVFTAEFTDFNNLQQTAPIGAIIAGSPGRAYVMVKGEAPNRPKTPLYAPADSVIQSLVYAKRDPNNPNAPGEYRLEFRISCEVTFNFDHMDEVVDKIKAVAPATPSERSNDMKYVSIPVKAGELVGYSNGTDLAGSFDLFLLNSTKAVPHINPKRWNWDQVKTADCPYDYYTQELKAKYYSIMRSHDGQVLENLSCGNPSHDIAGTASGGWFQGDSTDSQGKWLEIGNSNGRTEILLRDSGSHVFSIRDYKTTQLPDKLTVGQNACYEDSGKWAYLKLDSETKLSFAKGEGSCPTSPVDKAEVWER